MEYWIRILERRTVIGLPYVMECWSNIGYQTSEKLTQNAKMMHGHFSRNEIQLNNRNLTRIAIVQWADLACEGFPLSRQHGKNANNFDTVICGG